MIPNEKITDNKKKPLLLVCPLDWGLGHTTRMIPVISCLREAGCGVIVACNSTQKALLETEFPDLHFVYLKGYGIRYASNRTANWGKMLLAIPKILIKIKQERLWFLRFLKQNGVDAVISDNRYGLGNAGVPTVLVTHQLQVRSGLGRLADLLAGRFIYKKINTFTECWIPDYQHGNNLSGILSRPARLFSTPLRYLGCISRFENCASDIASKNILIILSGPEPQRTIFENSILKELREGNQQNIILVRGRPGSNEKISKIEGVEIFNHIGSKQLNEMICSSALIISRAGYTTIMDILKLKKKLVVVPTPGQGEQEYLASHLLERNMALALDQHEFSLALAIKKSGLFNYNIPDFDMHQYKKVITGFIASRFSL